MSAAERSGPQSLVVLLSLVSFANYLDRMVLNALSQPLKAEFALSDTQYALLTGFAFVLLYVFAALPLATLADRTSKGTVLACCLVIWSLATAACGLTRSFAQLLIARVCVGIGESGCQPLGYAIIADHFSSERRGTPTGWFLVGNSLGVTAGLWLGAWLGHTYGWRTAFVCVGLPGLVLAAILALYFRGAPKPAFDAPANAPRLSFFRGVRELLDNRTYRWVLLVNGVYSFLIFGPVAFLPAFFIRSHGLPLQVAGKWAGLSIGLGMALGMYLGGVAADRLARRSPWAPQLFCALAALATAIAYLAVLWLPDFRWAFVAAFFASAIGALGSPTNIATVQMLCHPKLRAIAASLATSSISLFGVGLAPLVVGMLSDALAPRFGTADALRYALMISMVVALPTAALNFYVAQLLRGARAPIALSTA